MERISIFSTMIAQELMRTEKYKKYITEKYIEDLSISSILHDIGKVGIIDKVLLKPGKLTSQEYEQIKIHPSIGGEALKKINIKIKNKKFLNMAYKIALYHHEKFDGTGYPYGIKAEKIPLSVRIVALVDVYDALTSKRIYKDTINHDSSVKIIKEERGRHFDPDIVDVFLKIQNQFKTIRLSLNM